ncbi:unnamed protein product [Prunus brigantina]
MFQESGRGSSTFWDGVYCHAVAVARVFLALQLQGWVAAVLFFWALVFLGFQLGLHLYKRKLKKWKEK